MIKSILRFIKNSFVGTLLAMLIILIVHIITNGIFSGRDDIFEGILASGMFGYPILIAVGSYIKSSMEESQEEKEARKKQELWETYIDAVDNKLVPKLKAEGYYVNNVDYNKGLIEMVDPEYDKYCSLVYSIVNNRVYKSTDYYTKQIADHLYGIDTLLVGVQEAILAPRVSVGVIF